MASGNIHFPEVNFDWLGQLPDIARRADIDRQSRATLADLNPNSITDLEDKGGKLLAAGNYDIGLRLLQQAKDRRAIEQRGANDAMQWEWLRNQPRNLPIPGIPGAGAAPEPTVPDVPLTAPSTPAAAPAAPFPAPGGGNVMPGLTEALPINKVAEGPLDAIERMNQRRNEGINPTTPGTGPGLVSPSEQMLAQAEGPAPVAPPPVQLAGPLPTPDTPPPASPVPSAPFMQGATIPAPPPMSPPVSPQPAPAAAASKVPMGTDPNRAAAFQVLQELGPRLAGMPASATRTGPGAAMMQQYRAAVAQVYQKPDEINYQQERMRIAQENVERAARGLPLQPDITRGDMEANKHVLAKDQEATAKLYENYRGKGDIANELGVKLERMQSILDNPKFVPGESFFNKSSDTVRRGIGNIAGLARQLGVPADKLPTDADIMRITEPAALREQFKAITNQAVVAALGGLGRQISDPDRNYMADAFPNLMQTKEGIQEIKDFLVEAGRRANMQHALARQYMTENGVRAKPWGLEEYIQEKTKDYGDKNPIFFNTKGELNQRGLDVKNAMDRAGPSGPAPRPVAPAPASSGRKTSNGITWSIE